MKQGYPHLLLAILLSLASFFLPSELHAQSWSGKQTSINANTGGFYEYLPVGYDGVKKFPVIVFLHGMGELGNGKSDLVKITSTGLPRLINNGGFPTTFSSGGNSYSFIVICPQFQNWPTSGDVDAVINYALANYSVDLSRVYLTGLSMGGGATWDHTGSSVSNATRLAAAVPICGASSPNPTALLNMVSANIPILATHNADDPIVTPDNTRGYVDGLNARGISPSAIKIIWPSGGHDAWTKTYDPLNKIVNGTMNVYEWMLQYKRGSSPTPPPAPLVASISGSTNPACYGQTNGSASATASGGTAPYTYSWSTSPAQTGATASNLGAGSYTVTVRDANGNTATATVTVTQPAALALTVSPGTITVNGGTTNVTVSATGGTAPYTFTGPTSNVKAGTYTYTVTDGKGCSDQKTINLTEPPVVVTGLAISTVTRTDVTCNGSSNGKAGVSVTGGVAPYSYSWSTSPEQQTAQASGLAAGTYTITVTDAAGNKVSSSVTINQPAPLSLSATAGTITVNGGTTNVTLVANGGTAPYAYTGTTTGVRAGTYTYSVTDANACKATTSLTISEPAKIRLVAKPGTIKCKGGSCNVALQVEGGVAPYAFTGDTTSLVAGTYTYTVSDATGATGSAVLTITEPEQLTLTSTASTINRIGGTTDVNLRANGGTAPFTYTGTAAAVKAGKYNYEVKDANGCTASSSIEVKEPSIRLSALTLSTTDTAISVKWSTSYEFAIDRFEIEKAKDDKTFLLLGRNKAKAKGPVTSDYLQADNGQVGGSNTYKLYAITDFGEKVYLGEKKLYFNQKGSVLIRNQVNKIDITVMSDREEKVVIMVYDALGRPVNQVVQNKGNAVLRTFIPMDNLKSGIYIVKVTTTSGMQTVKQVVKP